MRLPLFGIGLDGKTPAVTAKQLTNMYAQIRPAGEPYRVVAYPTPGLEQWVDFGDEPIRGMHVVGSLLYVVHRGTFWEVNAAGTKTSRGTLNSTSGKVLMADNGAQVMAVDGTDGYTYTIATTTFAEISDGDYPANAETVTSGDGFFVISVDDSQQFNISNDFDGTAWDALDFDLADSSPDNIARVYFNRGEIIVFGEKTTEFWGYIGGAAFPYSRISGANASWGLGAVYSVTEYDNGVAFLAYSQEGRYIVGKLVGYQLQRLSTPDLEAIINYYPTIDLTSATAFSYMLDGHPFYQINFGSSGSWLYDGSTGFWSKLKAYGESRHTAELGIAFQGFCVSDRTTGTLYKLRGDVYDDNGQIIEREIIGETFTAEQEDFPIDLIRLECESGMGGSVSLRVSRDRGKTWGTEMSRDIGDVGEYGTVVEWRRLGQAKQFTPKFRYTDGNRFVVLGASINP